MWIVKTPYRSSCSWIVERLRRSKQTVCGSTNKGTGKVRACVFCKQLAVYLDGNQEQYCSAPVGWKIKFQKQQ